VFSLEKYRQWMDFCAMQAGAKQEAFSWDTLRRFYQGDEPDTGNSPNGARQAQA
jgi:hypothetical protein